MRRQPLENRTRARGSTGTGVRKTRGSPILIDKKCVPARRRRHIATSRPSTVDYAELLPRPGDAASPPPTAPKHLRMDNATSREARMGAASVPLRKPAGGRQTPREEHQACLFGNQDPRASPPTLKPPVAHGSHPQNLNRSFKPLLGASRGRDAKPPSRVFERQAELVALLLADTGPRAAAGDREGDGRTPLPRFAVAQIG